MYRNFYSYNDMPQIMQPTEKKSEICAKSEDAPKKPEKPPGTITNIFGKLKSDDIILFAVILLLLADDCDDTLLLLAIGFIFISGLTN